MNKRFAVDADLGWNLSLLSILMACLPLAGFAMVTKKPDRVTVEPLAESIAATATETETEAETETETNPVPPPEQTAPLPPKADTAEDLIRKIREEKKRMGLE